MVPTFDVPSDADRMNRIIEFVNEGFEDRILISHDIHTKHKLVMRIKLDLFINLTKISI